MSTSMLFLPIAIPFILGLLTFLLPRGKAGWIVSLVSVLASAAELAVAIVLFPVDQGFTVPWLGFGIDLSLRLTRMSAFILLAIAGFSFLVSLYAAASMKGAPNARRFNAWMLITVAMASGAVLADNLVLLLVFWEGLLVTMFAMIGGNGPRSYHTAIKAVIIVGLTDLAMMLGVMLTGRMAGTLTISAITRLPVDGMGGAAFILLMVGAMGKAGAMPFHSWIPDAAIDAPLPFMAILPASIEKLLGIYFLARVSLDLYALAPGTWVSTVLMIAGGATILLAVMMALVQKDYKRLLSFHAISQVGYMILGIGTGLPIGIVGGLFHMVNHAMYKSCLFLTGGAVEKQAGTTDLEKLGGLGRAMPVTTICFLVAAASISGVPPFNGFFSKELVYDAALESGWVYYAVALLGSLFTAASFLKLGHAAFFGPVTDGTRKVREAPLLMLIPMIVLAGLCILFGVGNGIPLHGLIEPAVGPAVTTGHTFAGFPPRMLLVELTVAVILLAILNHILGVRRTGRGLGAVDHIHHAPVLAPIYVVAEKGQLDPYTIGRWVMKGVSTGLWGVDRAIDWVYETLVVKASHALSRGGRALHNGNLNRYVLWALAGAVVVVAVVVFASSAAFGGGR